ncbi:MAG TPA: adenylate/guanylate cyclase domain-containing protein [Gaiellaceae bacterium]|nr:adenylate/guanylate cyclase domain-containing protein [Gaiellaceae bacterium]
MARCPNCGQENPEGFRFCGACGTELAAAAPSREVRKTVTVVFGDVTGSTAMGERLDPESTRRVMARYFEAMRDAIEQHGGTVEKFIGDAVMAVFGIPVVHEDDALRAVRAAADMREALTRLNDELERDWGVRIESRIGVNTGEVVAGEGETLAVGDAVNVAARLEQGAAPGETLLGDTTYRLVRESVEADEVEPLDAKGKAEPVRAFRLLRVDQMAEFIPRRLDSPLVGRQNELEQLQRAYDHAVAERVAYQFTILGAAGIGKSRLVRELEERIDPRLLSGRCLPYGEGITYWPLAEIEPLAAEIDFGANRDEIALQTRRVLERMSRERPVVVVFDDLQWAEPTFLDLIDHVSDLARDAPMLILCVARPDLLDVRPGWGGGKLNATTLLLEALTEAEAEELADNLLRAGLDGRMKKRIATAAEGNPLFVEEMLAMLAENGDAEITVPPTIQALLASRLDRLGPDERTAVECAAVQGQEFRLDALADLVPDALAGRLPELQHSLVRKDLVRPTGEETLRFKHLLLRDAAYEALPKEQRAVLHERFANWLETTTPELEEIRGYHLEQAYRYRAELGPVDDAGRALARRASTLLAAAGRRARDRSDVHATTNLLERAIRLLPDEDSEAIALYPDLASAIGEGGDLPRADGVLRTAERLGDERTALVARQRRVWNDVLRGGVMADAVGPLEETVEEATRLDDSAILAEGLMRLGVMESWLGDNERAAQLLRRSLEHASAGAHSQITSDAIHWLALVLLWGPMPVERALAELRRLDESESTPASQMARAHLHVIEGTILALTGDFDSGRRLATAGRREVLELGQNVQYAGLSQPAAIIELLAGDAPAAERILREAHGILTQAGERGYLSTAAALLGLAVVRQGRHEEGERLADESREVGTDDDVITQIYWRMVKALALTAKGDSQDARRLATEALELTYRTDDAFDVPMVTLELADVFAPESRKAVLERALVETERKGNVVSAAQIRERLAGLP